MKRVSTTVALLLIGGALAVPSAANAGFKLVCEGCFVNAAKGGSENIAAAFVPGEVETAPAAAAPVDEELLNLVREPADGSV